MTFYLIKGFLSIHFCKKLIFFSLLQGILLVQELIDIYSLRVVQAYMAHIQNNSKIAVRNMLREIGKTTLQNTGKSTLQAVDYLDDGSPIRLRIDIDIDDGSAVCDFRYLFVVFTN